jgi:hypothetical protein
MVDSVVSFGEADCSEHGGLRICGNREQEGFSVLERGWT